MTFEKCLKHQSRLHPSLNAQDAAKLCYQAAFGAEHLLSDGEQARRYLLEELNSLAPESSEPLFEAISPDLCRVNLRAWKAKSLPADWLWRMFFASAAKGNPTGDIETCFRTVGEAARDHALPFSAEEWEAFLLSYTARGIAPLHHSEAYRAAEKPAYRLVRTDYVRFFPILERMAQARDSYIVAIDGRAASGKTTAARLLSEITGAGQIHMDDFFLPPSMRTPQRLASPGGNVHYERFAQELLPHLPGGREFSYRPWDCSKVDFGPACRVAASPLRIVEGAYAHHPALGDYADLKVFFHVEPAEQRERILRREGPEYARVFESTWIPLEERYIAHYAIDRHADLIL